MMSLDAAVDANWVIESPYTATLTGPVERTCAPPPPRAARGPVVVVPDADGDVPCPLHAHAPTLAGPPTGGRVRTRAFRHLSPGRHVRAIPGGMEHVTAGYPGPSIAPVVRAVPGGHLIKRSLVVAAVVATTFALFGAAGTAGAAPTWAPAATATVHPGVQTLTEGAQCTANFIFSDGTNVYIGQAAHCSSTGAATDTDGCTSDSLPIGTAVEVDGATHPGTMVYNSWLTMQ